MSASRWSECPKCTKKKIDVVAEVRKLYGTIPLEEFENRLKAANIAEDEETTESLREDWEIYIDDGHLVFSYGASCDCCDCGFSFQVKHKWKLK